MLEGIPGKGRGGTAFQFTDLERCSTYVVEGRGRIIERRERGEERRTE